MINTSLQAIKMLILEKWIDIASILLLFFLGKIILRGLVNRAIRLASDGDDYTHTKKEKQAETLGGIVLITGNVVIYLIMLLMFLRLLGVDITPILAGAGVFGLAIGFGTQTLVKDFVSGVFIILEHQYGIGDRVKIGTIEGTVKKITMRSTVLIDEKKNRYFISNGSVNNVVNYSYGTRKIEKKS